MSIDSLTASALLQQSPTTMRPPIAGTRHMVSAGHYLAAQAAFQILEGGGNAVDAGVAAGIALGVVQSDFVNFAGVAPIMIYLAEEKRVVTISGLGTWPAAASLDFFLRVCGGTIPRGLLRTVVPAAPDAWITALAEFGSFSFGDVAAAAIRFAGDGFPMHALMAEVIASFEFDYRAWPSNEAIYLPNGRVPRAGDRFVQKDLARTLQHMADEEKSAAGAGRTAGLRAARNAFYQGDIAATIAGYHKDNGGLLTYADMAGFHCRIEPPRQVAFHDLTVYSCDAWCQGPVLLQMLAIAEGLPPEGAPTQFDRLYPCLGRDREACLRRPRSALRRPALRGCPPRFAAVAGLRGPAQEDDRYAARISGPSSERARAPRRATQREPAARNGRLLAGHVLRRCRGPPRECLLGDAKRRVDGYARDPRNRPLPVLAGLAILGGPASPLMHRAG